MGTKAGAAGLVGRGLKVPTGEQAQGGGAAGQEGVWFGVGGSML